MRKITTYLPSIILSIALVFCILGTAGVLLAKSILTSESAYKVYSENGVRDIISDSLGSYYRDKANTTGIPSEVYTENITGDYIDLAVKDCIDRGFASVSDNSEFQFTPPENTALETAIDDFFSDYAESIGYTPDEEYEKKLDSAKDNAYKVIKSYCDIYKMESLYEHGVMQKISSVYGYLGTVSKIAVSVTFVVLVLLFLVNFKEISSWFYWTGVSCLISGIIGAVPCAYLLETGYFKSFSIKEPQVFTVFTSAMTSATELFEKTMIADCAVGVMLIILCAVAIITGRGSKNKK